MKNINVLLIEDSNEDQVNVARIIKKCNEKSELINYSLNIKDSLESALSNIDEKELDLILLDLSLPDTDGLNGLERLLNNFGENFPIIILTGNENDQLSVQSIKYGAQDYVLKKELSPYILSRAMNYALERAKNSKELDELRINQAMALKMATLGEMSANIAHEINNPLFIILANAKKILNYEESNLDHEVIKSRCDKVVRMAERISKIVKSLKNYSRNDSSELMEIVDLQELIDNTLGICSERFRNAGIRIEIDNVTDIKFLCNDTQISQVLLNLLNNSHDAIKDSKEKWIKIYGKKQSQNVHIFVEDAGFISNEEIKKTIFRPLFTTKPKGVGTGLGMSISKSIVEAHGGKIKLVNDQKNTTFEIILPLNLHLDSASPSHS